MRGIEHRQQGILHELVHWVHLLLGHDLHQLRMFLIGKVKKEKGMGEDTYVVRLK